MILPVAIEYDRYGLLEFVRCLQFDLASEGIINSKAFAYCETKMQARLYKYRDIVRNSHLNHQDIISQTFDIEPDTPYSFATRIDTAHHKINNIKILEIPAQEYLLKYGKAIFTSNITMLDANNNIINKQIIQVIAPKAMINFVMDDKIFQTSYIVPDNYKDVPGLGAKFAKYLKEHYTSTRTPTAPYIKSYTQNSNQSCTIYAVDYNGKIFKMNFDKLLELNLPLGNIITRTSDFTPAGKVSFVEGTMEYWIDDINVACGLYKQKLTVESTLQGEDLSYNFHRTINHSQPAVLVPEGIEMLKLRMPDNSHIQDIRCPRVLDTIILETKNALRRLICPQYMSGELKLNISKPLEYITFPDICQSDIRVQLKQIPNQNISLNGFSRGVLLELADTPDLEQINLNIKGITSTLGSRAGRRNRLIVNLANAPKFREFNLQPYDASFNYYNVHRLELNIASREYIINLKYQVTDMSIEIPDDLVGSKIVINTWVNLGMIVIYCRHENLNLNKITINPMYEGITCNRIAVCSNKNSSSNLDWVFYNPDEKPRADMPEINLNNIKITYIPLR